MFDTGVRGPLPVITGVAGRAGRRVVRVRVARACDAYGTPRADRRARVRPDAALRRTWQPVSACTWTLARLEHSKSPIINLKLSTCPDSDSHLLKVQALYLKGSG